MSLLYAGRVSGVSFSPHKANLRIAVKFFMGLLKEDKLSPVVRLKREINNPEDHNAVAVWIGQMGEMFHVGYVPRAYSPTVVAVGIANVRAHIEDFTTLDSTVVGVQIQIRRKDAC